MPEKLQKRKNTLCLTVLGAVVALVAIRCFFGFDPDDESFYYTIPLRFLKGDCPIIDEWQVSQFYSVLLCPVVFLYTAIKGSTEGILLFGRLLYCAIAGLLSLWIYRSFRCLIRPFPALTCALLYLFCARGNIMGLSYYKIYTAFLLIALLLYLHFENDGALTPGKWFLIGLFHGLACLCMPYFALFVLGLTLFLIIKKHQVREAAAYILAPVLVLVLYLSIIFSHGYGISDILTNFSYMLEDPSYQMSIFQKAFRTLGGLLRQCFAGIPFVLYVLWCNVRKKELSRHWQLFALVSLVLMAITGNGFVTPGALYDQLIFLSLPLLFIRKDLRKDPAFWRTGRTIYLYGILSAILFWLGSDTRTSCLVTGFMIAQIGAMTMLVASVEKEKAGEPEETAEQRTKDQKTAGKRLLPVLLAFCVFTAGFVRIFIVYRDESLSHLTNRISQGPAAGIFTEENKYKDYNAIYEGLEDVAETYGSDTTRIFISQKAPWAYLAADLKFGTCTAWAMQLNNWQQGIYYKTHPEMFPDIVIVLNDDVGSSSGFSSEVNPNAGNKREGFLWDQMQDKGYTAVVYDAFTAYVNPKITAVN